MLNGFAFYMFKNKLINLIKFILIKIIVFIIKIPGKQGSPCRPDKFQGQINYFNKVILPGEENLLY
jgi:hypothetical protein